MADRGNSERLRGFGNGLTDWQTDFCNCRVAFATEKINMLEIVIWTWPWSDQPYFTRPILLKCKGLEIRCKIALLSCNFSLMLQTNSFELQDPLGWLKLNKLIQIQILGNIVEVVYLRIGKKVTKMKIWKRMTKLINHIINFIQKVHSFNFIL